jgi:hypothetical protein
MPDGATLARVRHLVSQQDFVAAQQVLHDAMGRARQDPGQADYVEAEAAVLFAGVLLQLGDPAAAGSWAHYAYTAMRRLAGERDHRTLHTLGVLAVTQHRAGALDLASRHYQQLVAALSAVDGPDSERALAAKADAAGVEHRRGRCEEARALMTEVIAAHKVRNGPGHPVGVRMTARLAAMWRDCGGFQQARDLIAQARALAADDETRRYVMAAAEATANKQHRCGVAAAGPVVVPQAQDLLPPPKADAQAPPFAEWPEDDVVDAPAPPAPVFVPPPAPLPPVVPTTVMFRPQPPPLKPPKPPRTRNPARARALGVTAMAAAAMGAVSAVVWAMLASGKPATPKQSAPSQQPTPVVTATATPVAPVAEPSGPVGNLRLIDNGDSVMITWVYPANAKGPIIVSSAIAGEPMRALQSLPAGTESFTLPGLSPERDYCLTVTVAYAPDHMVMASPVCTDRKKKPSP